MTVKILEENGGKTMNNVSCEELSASPRSLSLSLSLALSLSVCVCVCVVRKLGVWRWPASNYVRSMTHLYPLMLLLHQATISDPTVRKRSAQHWRS